MLSGRGHTGSRGGGGEGGRPGVGLAWCCPRGCVTEESIPRLKRDNNNTQEMSSHKNSNLYFLHIYIIYNIYMCINMYM